MRILIIMGTRPEAIKFAPLIKYLSLDSYFELRICTTGQHKEMIKQVFDFFDIEVQYNLDLMQHNQTLSDLSARCLQNLNSVFTDFSPNIVFVQGDTTTASMGALASYYWKIPVAHLEAGLRSGDIYSPFPEEVNRKIISVLSTYHFTPTNLALEALDKEGITKNVWMVGNTVIDALLLGLETINKKNIDYYEDFKEINFNKKIVLVTAHRRESFGSPFENICNAIREISLEYKDLQFIYPVHLNPNVREVTSRLLGGLVNVNLIEPMDYPRLIWIMEKSYIVLTDSGGIQEEAPTLGKPVLVMRDVTERMEGVESGTAKLIGTDKYVIAATLRSLLENENGVYDKMAKAVNPYGDGTTAKKIIKILKELS